MPKTLYLIDGSGFIFRAYHALPPLSNPQGVPVHAVYGFLNMMLKLMEGNQADHVAVVFDASRDTFRNRIYSEYKAHRPPPPDDLVPQFAITRDAVDALGMPRIELVDYEADDIIATYVHQAKALGMEVTIVSSDKDLMQLIGDHVVMYDAMKDKYIKEPEVIEKFGVEPDKVREVLSLIGDSSDNVPGIPGIGPKTAAELIKEYGDVEGLLVRAHEIKQPKRRELILQHSGNARLSRELITLKHDVPGLPALESLAGHAPDPEKLMPFLQHHGLKALIARMQKKFNLPAPSSSANANPATTSVPLTQSDYRLIDSEAILAEWIAKARQQGCVAFRTETTALNPMHAELVGVSLCLQPGVACYVPLRHKSATAASEPVRDGDLFSAHPAPAALAAGQIDMARALALLTPLLEDTGVLKIGHNTKYDMLMLERHATRLHPVEDTMLLSYILYAGKHGQELDELSERYLDHTPIPYDAVTGTGKARLPFDQVAPEQARAYAAEKADVVMRLYHLLKPKLMSEKLLSVYETIERPLISVLARMEHKGIKIDPQGLGALSQDFGLRMQAYEQEIFQIAGHSFNIGSPKQLGEVLFDELKLPGGRKSGKSGAYTTDSEVLEELAGQGFPLPAKVMEWRQLSKLKNTYSDALASQMSPLTHRVHTHYAMAVASTGRLSSTDPNLQNIPIRTLEGKKIRETFVAQAGYKLLSADYSQIELRLLAHMADIPTLREAFRNGDDIHAITAGQMFGVPSGAVDADLRRKAKTINFGIIYGISAHGLAVRLGIPRNEAGAYIERYFAQYPGIRDYMESNKAFARKHGYVTTLFGRRCHVPGILDKNPSRRQFSERAAINAPLQGTAADIIKRAMIAIDQGIGERALGISESTSSNDQSLTPEASLRMLLQVHDELVFEVKEDQAESMRVFVRTRMENAASLSVPLTVETGVGEHWGEAH